MNIQTAVSGIRSFSELLPIAEHAQVRLSFWGSRYIHVVGYEGTIHIDALASHAKKLLKQLNYEFSEDERAPGRRLAARIDVLYAESDRQFNAANSFTKTLATVRKVICSIFSFLKGGLPPRFEWQGPSLESNDDFEHYTQAQLQRVFNLSPDEAERRGYILGWIGGRNLRWRVREGIQ
jgi:hypothetical protein